MQASLACFFFYLETRIPKFSTPCINARGSLIAKASYKEAVKHIYRYLQGVKENRLLLSPTNDLTLDCYVDANFAGTYGYKDDQDPICVKSRTGFVLTLGGCPIAWSSKLQSEIALSTNKAKYIALSQALRDLLPTK